MSEEIFSEDDCIKILQQSLKHDFKFQRMELLPFSENTEGFMGQHHLLKLTYTTSGEEKTNSFFVKTKPKNTFHNKIVEGLLLYKKEVFFYNFLIKEFEKSGYKIDFVPMMLYCKNTETIVLENLKEKDYISNSNLFSGEEELRVVLQSLATFHANCLSYEERRSKKLGRPYSIVEENKEVFKETIFVEDKNSMSSRFFEGSVESLMVALKLIPQSAEWKQILIHKLLNFHPEKIINKELGFRKTVTHSDLWRNNILFKYNQDKIEDCRLIDFQVIRYYYPAFDVLFLIYLQTRRDLREQIYSSLIQCYYSKFLEVLQNNGFSSEVFPEDQFMKSLEAVRALAFYNAVCYRTVRFMPKEIMDSTSGTKVEAVFFTKDLRMKLIEDLYKNNETARDVMTEDIYEMYEVL